MGAHIMSTHTNPDGLYDWQKLGSVQDSVELYLQESGRGGEERGEGQGLVGGTQ